MNGSVAEVVTERLIPSELLLLSLEELFERFRIDGDRDYILRELTPRLTFDSNDS